MFIILLFAVLPYVAGNTVILTNGNTQSNCTKLDADVSSNPLYGSGFFKSNILISPIRQADTIAGANVAMDASESRRYSVATGRFYVSLHTNPYESIIDNSNIITVTVNNGTRWKKSKYNVKYTISGCINTGFNNQCRWMSPIACSDYDANNNVLPYSNINSIPIFCSPLMYEWQFNKNTSNYSTRDRNTDTIRVSKNINWNMNLSADSVLLNPTSFVSNKVFRKKKTMNLNYGVADIMLAERLSSCLSEKPQMLIPREQQNLGTIGVFCKKTNGYVTMFGSRSGWFTDGFNSTTLCIDVTSVFTVSGQYSDPHYALSVRYPPAPYFWNSDYFVDTSGSYYWRPINKYKLAREYDSDEGPTSLVSNTILYIMTVMGACINECSSNVPVNLGVRVYRLQVCDILCFLVQAQSFHIASTFKSNSNKNVSSITLGCNVNTKVAAYQIENLKELNSLFDSSASFSDTTSIDDLLNTTMYCTYMASEFVTQDLTYLPISYDQSSFDEFDDDTSTTANALIVTPPSNTLFSLVDGRSCEENDLDFNSPSSLSSSLSFQARGRYTGATCAHWVNDVGLTTNSTFGELVYDLLHTPTSDKTMQTGALYDDSIIIILWLQQLQNAVLSVVTTAASLSYGKFVTSNYSSTYDISKHAGTAVLFKFLLTLSVITGTAMINAASIASLVVNIVRAFRGVTYYTTAAGRQDGAVSSIIYESSQRGTIGIHPWPGLVIAFVYSVALFALLSKSVHAIFWRDWIKTIGWLRSMSYESHVP